MSNDTHTSKWTHTLSLAMMVKNEAATLEKCLRLARPHVDEIVVVDTGSTDGTRKIARRYADVYDEIEWPDSFSEARNHSFDLASGDFIMYLDGDEYIEDDESWQQLRAALAPDLACLQIPIKNLLREGTLVSADRAYQERVFCNEDTVRFEGRIHNQIIGALNDYLRRTRKKVRAVAAEVTHVGYAHGEEKRKKKYRPRIRLIEAEYRDRAPGQMRTYYGFQLGVMYFTIEEHQTAYEVLQQLDYSQLIPINAFYGRLIAAQASLQVGRADVALEHAEHMLSLSRVEPVAYYAAGVALIDLGRVLDGLLMLMEAYVVNASAAEERRFQLNGRSLVRFLREACSRLGLDKHAKLFGDVLEQGSVQGSETLSMITSLRDNVARSAIHQEKAA